MVKVVTATAVPEAKATPLPAFNIPFKNPDTLINATIGDAETLDPAWTYETFGAAVESNIYEGLIYFNREKVDEFVPALATDWTASADGLSYTFNIRKGVTFHEGGTLEPHDVAYSIRRALLQDRSAGPQWMTLYSYVNQYAITDLAMEIAGVDDFAAVDEANLTKTAERIFEAVQYDDAAGTVTLNFVNPSPWFFQILAQPFGGGVVDQEWAVENGEWDGQAEGWVKWHDPAAEDTFLFDHANGTGPYKLDHWTPAEEIVIVAYEDYWRTEPIWEGGPSGVASIQRVVWKEVDEWGTRLAMVQAGDADLVAVPRAYISQMDPMVQDIYTGGEYTSPKTVNNPNGALRLFKDLPSAAATHAGFTFKVDTEGGNPFIGSGELDGNGIPADFFSDIDVRKGVSYCIDYETLIRDVLAGEGFQAKGPIIAGMMGYDENQATYTYDLAKAEEHFKKAWGGEVWDKGFYLQVAYNTGNDTRRLFAEILEQGLEAVNPKFNVVALNIPWPSFLAARRAGKLPISVIGWLEDYHDPSNWVDPYLNCETGAFAHSQEMPEDFCAQVSDLIAKGLSSNDPAVREPYYKELQNLAYEFAPTIWAYQAVGRHYEQNWIQGYYYNPIYPGLWAYRYSKVAP